MHCGYQSQDWTAQDRFVAETLKFSRDGYFLDVGCHHYMSISNTYFLEKELNWKGVAVDLDCNFGRDWQTHRPNSMFVCGDAVSMNYKNLLEENNAPKVIDYLSVDIAPPYNTFLALKNIMNTDYTFKIITFETEQHQNLDMRPRDESRALLPQKGYKFIKEVVQDDFWIHSDYIHLL